MIIPQGVIPVLASNTLFIAKLALFLALIFAGTLIISKILKELLRIPVVAGQIIAGIMLGPSLFNCAQWPLFVDTISVHTDIHVPIYTFYSSDLFLFIIIVFASTLTVSYLLWLAGYETDVRELIGVGDCAIMAGVFGAILPIISTTLLLIYFFSYAFSLVQAVGLGIIFSATSVSIPVAMLVSYKKMHLKSSKATLGASIVDDIVAVILLSIFFIMLQSGFFGQGYCSISAGHDCSITQALFLMGSCLVGFSLIGYFVLPRLMNLLQARGYSHLLPAVAHISMLVYFAAAELIGGLAGITGAYFAGLFHRLADKEHKAEKVIAPYVHAFLLPLFLGSIGLTINMWAVSGSGWVIIGAMLIIAILAKLAACYLAIGISSMLRFSRARWSWLEGYLFGSSMVARGEVGLVVATILRGTQVITPEQYIMAVVVIILTTIATPLMLALGFSWLPGGE